MMGELFSQFPGARGDSPLVPTLGVEEEKTLISEFSRVFEKRKKGQFLAGFQGFGSPGEGRVAFCLVHDDMPFLVESFRAALIEAGLRIDLVAHPVVHLKRNGRGEIADYQLHSRHHQGGI